MKSADTMQRAFGTHIAKPAGAKKSPKAIRVPVTAKPKKRK